ncbi:MAG: hypothetical protein HY586_04345 [Candidatus Omnitrophica bacterium]|nr:hypothetical protein [Candidatus Omnitrophota bacterium]
MMERAPERQSPGHQKKLSVLLSLWLLVLSCSGAAGCSADHLAAMYQVVQAEDAFQKAYDMRIRPGAEKSREELYRKAHGHFLKAYHTDKTVFTLTRIQQAHDTCVRARDSENAAIFEDFAQQYSQEHPAEAEYGDAPTSFLGPME